MKKEKINIIKNCPSCESELERINDQLFCKNNTCPSKSTKQIEKFCKVLGLKGFGPRTIEKLDVQYIADIFTLTENEYIEKLGEATGRKLYSAVANLQEVTLTKFLAALSIPGLGETLAAKLASEVSSIEEINDKICNQVFGEKTALKVSEWFKENSSVLNSIKLRIVNEPKKTEKQFSVCVTGKIEGYTRDQIKQELARHGISLTSSVSKDTKYLICEDTNKSSSKLIKAKQNKIDIITYEQLKEQLYG